MKALRRFGRFPKVATLMLTTLLAGPVMGQSAINNIIQGDSATAVPDAVPPAASTAASTAAGPPALVVAAAEGRRSDAATAMMTATATRIC